MDLTTTKLTENEAARFERQYEPYMETVAEAFEERYKGKISFTSHDKVALGKYLQTWESLLPILNEDATSRDNLGEVLKVGLDLVALQYATLPIQMIASVQPLAEEAGVVYFRKATATLTRGGITKGDELISGTGKANPALSEYVAEEVIDETKLIAAGPSAGPYTYQLNAPVRPRGITVNVAGKIRGIDDGEGHILGAGIDPDASTINYFTGAFTLSLVNPGNHVAAGDRISIIYQQNISQSVEIPGFKYDLIGKTVNVRYYLLQSQFTSIANYIVRQRFGKSLADDVARDTVAQINGAVLVEAIKKLRTSAIKNETMYPSIFPTGTISWDSVAPTGVSEIDHRRTFTDLIEVASNKVEDMSGRSAISFMIVGQKGRQILNSIGFAGERKQVPGPYLAGYFEGIPVFYAPSTIMPNDEVVFAYRGLMWYESPLVYGPFLPTTIVKATGNPNVFVETYGVAHGAAVESVVPEFVVRGRII